ncbi:hypothetical protein CRENBAI_006867 [Crenichthys baileyi]|uniref:CDAN1-interacting nuclease 1 n=1 Tax=Crenichthys baileyi TaxID=28760 RepID=A0AAV9SCI6_9TELE
MAPWLASSLGLQRPRSIVNCLRMEFGPGLVIYWYGFIEELDCQRDRGLDPSKRRPLGHHRVARQQQLSLSALPPSSHPTHLTRVVQNNCPHVSS